MGLIIINCSLLLILFIAVMIGISAKNQKKVKSWLIISRLLYLTLLVTRILTSFYFTPLAPLQVSIKLLLVILIIVLIELFFARKQANIINLTSYLILSGTFLIGLLVNLFV